MADEDDILGFFGADPRPATPAPKPAPKPSSKPKKSAPSAAEFKTTRRVVGGEERCEGQQRVVMVYGGMIVEIPQETFVAFLKGMQGEGWSALRYDEHADLVGGMREIARRLEITPAYLRSVFDKRSEEEPEQEELDLDELLKGL